MPMHIPDGFLDTPVWVGLNVAALPAVGVLARKAQKGFDHSRTPLLGVMGAFVFAAQMINFPVGVGTSGHLIGGALLACTLGPAAAAVTMTAILAIQALIFQDGGVLALGANVMNMAVCGTLAAYLPYHFWGRGRWRRAAIFLGGALSVLVGALLAISELLLSGIPMPGAVLGVSLGLFMVSAVLEGAITVAVVGALEGMQPDFVHQPSGRRSYVLGALASAAILLSVVGVLFASANPDGLEKLAADVGIASRAKTLFATPLADYEAGFFESPWARKAGAGMAGLVLMFGASVLLGRFGKKRSV
ncbi:MAG TPA: energy-coupling factor ABC transporter permease [Bryobacteraceae bacterium]|nr:energy-coupling factor ABC transporter permease [Bryobacteraceae bacterium]